MSREVLFERDLLYPTDNLNEPGSVHLKVFSPNSNATIPVLLESKSGHSPLKYIDVITNIMQSDIFDRILINVKKSLIIFIPVENAAAGQGDARRYSRVQYINDSYNVKESDDIEIKE